MCVSTTSFTAIAPKINRSVPPVDPTYLDCNWWWCDQHVFVSKSTPTTDVKLSPTYLLRASLLCPAMSYPRAAAIECAFLTASTSKGIRFACQLCSANRAVVLGKSVSRVE